MQVQVQMQVRVQVQVQVQVQVHLVGATGEVGAKEVNLFSLTDMNSDIRLLAALGIKRGHDET